MTETTIMDNDADGAERRDAPKARPIRHDVLALQEASSGAVAAVTAFRVDLACTLKALGVMDSVATDLLAQAETIETLMLAQGRDIRRLRDDLDAARDDAGRDALTGLPNRRAAEKVVSTPVDHPRSVAFVDIDRFKSINDTYGHGFGDRVLRHVASVLVDVCGEGRVHRWGGEEFLVVLDGMALEAATAIMDEARAEVSAMEIKLRANDPPLAPVTFSAGVSDKRVGDEAVAQADELLYFAKRNGRDQVTSVDRIPEDRAFPTREAA